MDSWSTPRSIRLTHIPDQVSDLRIDLVSSGIPETRFPSPEQFKSLLCQRMTVSGLMMSRASFQRDSNFEIRTKRTLSEFWNCGLFAYVEGQSIAASAREFQDRAVATFEWSEDRICELNDWFWHALKVTSNAQDSNADRTDDKKTRHTWRNRWLKNHQRVVSGVLAWHAIHCFSVRRGSLTALQITCYLSGDVLDSTLNPLQTHDFAQYFYKNQKTISLLKDGLLYHL